MARPSKYDALKLENEISFPLYACSKEITRRYKPFLDKLDLTYTQYLAMMVLWERKELSVSDLGKALYLDSGTLTPLLKKLEAKGYVERRRSSEDERKVLAAVTPAGTKLRNAALKARQGFAEELDFDPEDTRLLFMTLNWLLEQLEEEQPDELGVE